MYSNCMGTFSQEIQISGHLIDSMILANIFNKIMDLQGEFEVEEINVGKRKNEQSFARLLVTGKNQEHLDEILEAVYRLGASVPDSKRDHAKEIPQKLRDA